MDLDGLIRLVASEPVVSELIAAARSDGEAIVDAAVPEAMRPLVVAALARAAGRPLLVVTSTYREAEAWTDALASLLGDSDVAYYPAWETLPHERLSPRSDTVGRRLDVLRRLAGVADSPAPAVIVAPVRAVLQPQTRGLGQLRPVRLAVGADHDIEEVARALVDAAYVRVDLVERRGEFAVRGGIIDVFPPTEEHPLRVDFFGDTIEEIRPFSVADQRSGDLLLSEVTASPCRELLLTDAVRARAARHAGNPELPAGLVELFERIAEGHAVDGMEALAPALVDGMELLVDVLAPGTRVVLSDPERVRARALELHATSQEFLAASWAAAAEGGKAPIDLEASAYRTLGKVRTAALARGLGWWTLASFAEDPDVRRVDATASEVFRATPSAPCARSRTPPPTAGPSSWWPTRRAGPPGWGSSWPRPTWPGASAWWSLTSPTASGRPHCGSWSSPRGTCRGSATLTSRPGGCPRGAATRSTPSRSPPVSTSCTTSTASDATSR